MTVAEMPKSAQKYADRISVLWKEYSGFYAAALADGFVWISPMGDTRTRGIGR